MRYLVRRQLHETIEPAIGSPAVRAERNAFCVTAEMLSPAALAR
jgi:hypothetical protein